MAEEGTSEEQAGAEAEAVQKKGGGAEAAPAGGGGSQKLVMIVLLLNTVVIIAIAAIFFISSNKRQGEVTLNDIAASKEGAAEGHGEEKAEGHGKEGKKEGKEGKEGEGGENENFIKESFTVNLADTKEAHLAKVDVEIEVSDAAVKEEVNRLRPKIRDFILVVLSSKSYDQIESIDGKDFLREEIRNKINGYLSRGKIKNVYFTQFIMQ